jgi:glycosyltransferase involved in cell wall biosynthesis
VNTEHTLVLDVRANGNTGIARYGSRLLTESLPGLADIPGKVYAVVRDRDVPALAPLFESSGVELIAPPGNEGRYARRDIWLRDFVADVRPNLFYTTNYTMDRAYQGPFVVTIHDLVRLMLPAAATDEEFVARYGEAEFQRLRRQVAPDHQRGPVFGPYFEELTRTLAAQARMVATVSTATAEDIRSVLGVPAQRISIVPSAVDEVFRPRERAAADQVRSRFSLGDSYFVFVGVAGTHKRVDRLIRWFDRWAPPGAQLAVVGGDAEGRADIRRAAADTDAVVFTGRLSDDDLAGLYTGAVACLSASVKEGFDLPPAEALACGSEAIVTDIPAHREVLGPHAHYFPVDDEVHLGQLVTAAADGRLALRSPGFAPPAWTTASHEFLRTIQQAMVLV